MRNWYETVDEKNPSVVSSRIRLARNIKGIPFPKRMNDNQKKEILETLKNLLDGISLDGVGTLKYINMDALPEEQLFAMVERHIISPDFANKQGPKGLVISENEAVSIMLLEEDHIRIQVLMGGFVAEKAYKIANEIENIFTQNLDIAFDTKLGYLTECPTNLGTGLRASVMLHLPILESTGLINSLVDSVSKIGLTIRGMYGEGSRSEASLYQLSNQVTLGISEQGAIDNLTAIANQLIEREMNSRLEMDKVTLEDTVFRALGILKYARKISSNEVLKLISHIKLGISMGIIENIPNHLPITLLIETKPAFLQSRFGIMTPNDRDICRANVIREALK